ncbi:hypothetical protein [Salinarimonas rosea]|uniref:hypothetical protein n=1 Tax=Salinarimonas rosea TaxID=552063 RepID=UPI000408D371|nr:hypothetical protein [Salinarimonas rosea]
MTKLFAIGHDTFLHDPSPTAAERRALIVERTRRPKQRGRYRRRGWLLRIEPAPPTGNGAPTELAFDTLEQAEGYARRAGLDYEVVAAKAAGRSSCPGAAVGDAEAGLEAWAHLWTALLRARYGLCDPPLLPEVERGLSAPSAAFASPWRVIAHPALDETAKRAILERWTWDELALERLAEDGGITGDGSRLDEVRRAIHALGAAPTTEAPELGLRAPEPESRSSA